MPGTANTNAFMLGTATVMIGAQDDVFDLNPTNHSIGLVKNFSISSEPNYTELTQGVKNTLVDSVMTSNAVRATMEAYEFTAKNLSWGLGLNGSNVSPLTDVTTTDAAADGSSTPVSNITVTDESGFSTDDYVAIEVDQEDHVIIRKVTSTAAGQITVDNDIDVLVPSGAKVRKVNAIDVGAKTNQPYLSAKVVGQLSNGEFLTLLLPKFRISRGFNLNFSTDDYGNLPIEFSVYDLVTTDTHFNWFGGATARIFRD